MTLRRCAAFLLVASAIVGCAPGVTVTRRNGDRLEQGRRVPPAGYAYYATAVYLEAHGEPELAREAYFRARKADPKSGSAWAGLAQSYCTDQPQRAEQLFSQGLKRAAELYPLYLTRSSCRLSRGETHGALEDAQIALRIAPQRREASEALARAADAAQDPETAERTRRALQLYEPQLVPEPSPSPSLETVDQALLVGDLSLAQSYAAGFLQPGHLAVRALFLERHDLAATQAELVLGASPSDADALLTTALLTDGLPNAAPSETPRTPSAVATPNAPPPSPLGACVFASYLLVRTGKSGAREFLLRLPPSSVAASSGAPPAGWNTAADPLLRECAQALTRNLETTRPR